MKHWEDMHKNRLKLYAFIWKYLRQESMVDVKRHTDNEVIKTNRDVQHLWEILEETHKVSTISQIAVVVKKSAKKEYQMMQQGPYESIITYKQRFDIALKTYQDQLNAELAETNITKVDASYDIVWYLVDIEIGAPCHSQTFGQMLRNRISS
jgi:hypothetical protein